MVTMPTSLGLNFANREADFIDINGDGLPDVVNTANPKHVFHLNQLTLTSTLQQDKHDFPSSLVTSNPTETSAKLSSPSVQLLDFDGDGYTDLVDAVTNKIYLNKGNTKWESNVQTLQSYPITNNDPNVRFFDYNGDKKIDILRSDGSATSYWVNDGKGSWQRVTGGDNIGLGFSKDRLRLIDINGDGLMDV
ncbi:MAG: VCBS repeat-containing protein [Deltaproteobacteria bacterium]|nr:MAG: VCBS repeat-containing protein [Deltaproteobacteria bacterium]